MADANHVRSLFSSYYRYLTFYAFPLNHKKNLKNKRKRKRKKKKKKLMRRMPRFAS